MIISKSFSSLSVSRSKFSEKKLLSNKSSCDKLKNDSIHLEKLEFPQNLISRRDDEQSGFKRQDIH